MKANSNSSSPHTHDTCLASGSSPADLKGWHSLKSTGFVVSESVGELVLYETTINQWEMRASKEQSFTLSSDRLSREAAIYIV